jgi:hypothetical protein
MGAVGRHLDMLLLDRPRLPPPNTSSIDAGTPLRRRLEKLGSSALHRLPRQRGVIPTHEESHAAHPRVAGQEQLWRLLSVEEQELEVVGN